MADLKLAYSQFLELEVFSRFSTQLDEETRAELERGRRVREVLKQREGERVPPVEQVAALLAAATGTLDEVPLEEIEIAGRRVRWATGWCLTCGATGWSPRRSFRWPPAPHA